MGIEALGLLGITAAGGDDLALIQERIRDRNRLIEQATRIVAEVDDETFELVRAELAGQIADRLFQPFGGLLAELRDADIANVIAFGMERTDFTRITSRTIVTSIACPAPCA